MYLSYGVPELVLAIIGLVLLVGGCLLARSNLKFGGLPLSVPGILLIVVGIFAEGGSIVAANSRYDVLTAKHALQQQGFTVLDIDLSLSHNQATLKGPGGCIVRRDVQPYGTSYGVFWNGKLGTPAALSCDGN